MADIFTAVTLSDDIVRIGPDMESGGQLQTEETPAEVVKSISQEDLENAKLAGYSQGFSEGLAEAETKMTDQLSLLGTLLQNIPTAVRDNRLQLSGEIADIVLLITKQFFVNQQQNKDVLTQQVNQILSQLNDKQSIELSMHPQDLALLQQGKLKLNIKACNNLRIIPDDNLRLGGCVVRSEHGVFDASIERQIDHLKQVLLQMKSGVSLE